MNWNKLFDLYCHMTGSDTATMDYDMGAGIVLNEKEKRQVVQKKIQSFMHDVAYRDGGVLGNASEYFIQAFTGSSDLPVLTKDVFNVTNKTPNFDLFWQEAFRGVRLMKGQLSWEIATVDTEAVFVLIPEGGKVRFEHYKGEKVMGQISKYGMGIGITWETIEGRKLYKFIEQVEQVRAKLYKLWADIHYTLLATAGAENKIDWQAGDTIRERDIITINFAYESLGEATKDSGYGDTANSNMLLYASPKLKARILQALRQTMNDPGANAVVEYNVDPRFTWNANIPSNKALLVLPQNKIQNAVYLNELGLSRQDMESLNELRSYWTAFGAVIADTKQVFEVSFS